MTTNKARKYYGLQWMASHPVSIEHCVKVLAFGSAKDRDAWVQEGTPGTYFGYGMHCRSQEVYGVHYRSRKAVSQREAAWLMGRIMAEIHGERQSGRKALAYVDQYVDQ